MSSVIRTATGLRILAVHLAPVQAVGRSDTQDDSGRILSAGGDGGIRSWAATNGADGGLTVPAPSLVKS